MSSTENTGEKQSGIDHLMTTMMIGFELTGVLGTGITQYFIHRRDSENNRSEEVITHKEDALYCRRLFSGHNGTLPKSSVVLGGNRPVGSHLVGRGR